MAVGWDGWVESWLFSFSLVCGLFVVCHGLFAHLDDVIGRLWVLIVFISGHSLYCFIIQVKREAFFSNYSFNNIIEDDKDRLFHIYTQRERERKRQKDRERGSKQQQWLDIPSCLIAYKTHATENGISRKHDIWKDLCLLFSVQYFLIRGMLWVVIRNV